MMNRNKVRRLARWRKYLARGVLAPACAAWAAGASAAAPPMVIAPHLSGEAFCASAAADPAVVTQEQAAAYCAARNENAASRITAFLYGIGPAISPSGHFALGYTLTLPLLGFYHRQPSAGWVLDRDALNVAIRTVRDVNRPVVVYLSANHFTDGGIELSDELSRDPRNLMWTRHGPLKSDGYFTVSLHAWTLTDMDAPITRLRREAFTAAMEEICRLDAPSRARIAGVSVLGEVHELVPNLTAGQGFDAGFDITDYSPISAARFADYLRMRFGTIDRLNTWMDASFQRFEDIQPPSRDIRRDVLHNFFEHIDAFAAGKVAVQGWAFDPSGRTPHVSLYLDGRFRGETLANLNRADVAEANKAVTSQNVGWRFDLDYRREPVGVHTLEVFLEAHGRKTRIARRGLTVVARDQRPSPALPATAVQADAPDPKSPVLFYIDGPAPLTPLFYNPLAELWLEYRNKVVADYLAGFATIAARSCLGPDAVFSHQILPELNSSWNRDLLAVEQSQRPNPIYHQGATLYGGAAYGPAFFDWARAYGWTSYAVSELHPRFNRPVSDNDAMFEDHRAHGARFVAPYFMSITPPRVAPPLGVGLNAMVIDPTNHVLGSDTLYESIVDIMRHR
jgi:hypothetical protein